jgi:Mn-containing catalase
MILRLDRWGHRTTAALGSRSRGRQERPGADGQEIVAVFNGPHPETGEDLIVDQGPPEGAPPVDLPAQPAVFAPDYAPEEIAKIAQRLRKEAGLPDKPTGEVANGGQGVVEKVKGKLT